MREHRPGDDFAFSDECLCYALLPLVRKLDFMPLQDAGGIQGSAASSLVRTVRPGRLDDLGWFDPGQHEAEIHVHRYRGRRNTDVSSDHNAGDYQSVTFPGSTSHQLAAEFHSLQHLPLRERGWA